MDIVAVACVRDEIDIIEAFVRHNVKFVSRLVVLDNGSTDGTLDVLYALSRDGLPLEVIEDRSLGKFLSQRLTWLAQDHAIGLYGANWVLPLDADEFLVLTGSEPLVPDWARTDQPVKLKWRSYVPDASDDRSEVNPVIRIRHRLLEEGWPWEKVLIPAPLLAQSGAIIAQGSHSVERGGRVCPGIETSHACLAHFPIRSRGQFVAKTIIGHLQNEVMPHRPSGWGFHHRDNFEHLKQDPDAFLASYAGRASCYSIQRSAAMKFTPQTIDDPLRYRGETLRHTPQRGENMHIWYPVLQYVQTLAREHAVLKASLTEDGRRAHEHVAGAFRFLVEQLQQRDRLLEEQMVLADRLRAQLREIETRDSGDVEGRASRADRLKYPTSRAAG